MLLYSIRIEGFTQTMPVVVGHGHPAAAAVPTHRLESVGGTYAAANEEYRISLFSRGLPNGPDKATAATERYALLTIQAALLI